MTANDQPAAGFIDHCMRAILTRLNQLALAPKFAQAEVVVYSIQKWSAVFDSQFEPGRL